MNYELAEVLYRSRWAMGKESLVRLWVAAKQATPDAIQAMVALRGQRSAAHDLVGDIAVVNVFGPITYRETLFSLFFGGATVEGLRQQLRSALADSAAKAVVLRFDTPGGAVDAVPEMAAELHAARGTKPIIAVSDTLMASAGYWLGSQTDQLFVSPSAMTGSVGVFTMHADISEALKREGVDVTLIFAGEHKVDGHPFAPLPDDVRQALQTDVDDVHADFIAAVARGRRTTQKAVRESYGQGLLYNAKDAVKLGLADGIATFDEVLQRTAAKVKRSARSAQAGVVDLAIAADATSTTIAATAEAVAEAAAFETISIVGTVLHTNLDPLEEEAAQPIDDTAAQAADQDYMDAAIKIAERL